jgi:5-methylcytosine-specific restriction protein B
MKQYVLNYRALINGNIISPFEIIRDHSLTGSVEKKADQIFKDCNKYFSDGSKDSLAKAGMIKFIERAIEANLISDSNKTYKILDPEIYNIKLSEFQMTTDDFQERYLGGSIKAQENYVKEIIDQSVPIPKSRNTMSYPLNQILFGPPGTGKTYSTITKALDIIGVEYNSYEEAQELFQEELGNRLEFVTMHQSFSYEDFVQGLKPKKSEDGNGIVFDYKNGVFKEICRRASEYSDEGISETLKKDISHNDKLIAGFFISKFNGRKKEDQRANQALNANGFSEAFKLISDKLDIKVNTIKAYRDQFDYKFDHRNGYAPKNSTISVQAGLGKLDPPYDVIYNEYVNKSFEEVYDEVEQILKKSKNTPLVENINTNDNFVIILDEINRANISRVFGELIALIEKDKRDGKLTVTLPSGEPFTVPSNLHIIGTMNTADKSIALVDIALRRRFEFIPLYPDPKILKQVLEEKGLNKKDTELRVELFTNLNRIIRAKKSVDFEIGHSYFMEDENLIDILNKQVLPLLNEYFMYDLKKVKDILEKQQKDREGKEIPKLGITLNKSVWENRGLLKVESINDSKEKETTAAAVTAE